MEATLRVLNELERDGVLVRYAIGGAIGAIFYMEPFLTYDLDIFVLPESGGLLSVSPIYESLKSLSYQEERECVLIEGMLVQFQPANKPKRPSPRPSITPYANLTTRVLRAEHLAAIMVQTGRPKDQQRFSTFMQQATLDLAYLSAILHRHQLTEKFHAWKSQTQTDFSPPNDSGGGISRRCRSRKNSALWFGSSKWLPPSSSSGAALCVALSWLKILRPRNAKGRLNNGSNARARTDRSNTLPMANAWFDALGKARWAVQDRRPAKRGPRPHWRAETNAPPCDS